MEVMHYVAQLPNWLASKFSQRSPKVDIEHELRLIRTSISARVATTDTAFEDVAQMLSTLVREHMALSRRVEKLERYAGMLPPDDYTPTPTALPAPAPARPKLQLVYDHNTHEVIPQRPLSPALQIGTAIAASALQQSMERQSSGAKDGETAPVA